MPLLDPAARAARARVVAATFAETYGAEPAVVAIAPGRVNLIGEHTDYNAGLCLPLALPHATWAALRPTSEPRIRITSAQQDGTWEGGPDQLGPGQVHGWVAYAAGVVWALRESGLPIHGLDLHVDSTVPVGAGLSSSAALECAVAVAVVGGSAQTWAAGLDDDRRRELVAACIRAETEVAEAPTGGMDQTVAMLAREQHALLIDFDSGETRQVPLELDTAGLALLVTDTRVSHALVDGGYGDRRAECDRAAQALGLASLRAAGRDDVEALADPLLRRRARHVVTENDRVVSTVAALHERDWTTTGALMVASHASMRDDFEISCAELDLAVETAVGSGALGARMTGGGFGGSSVALVEQAALADVAAAIDEAFAAAGHAPPQHLDAVPSAGAAIVTTSD